ncbi:18903_t:CDS:2 [Racocetra fulgida]|uniref:18903_t:CDS:1 n=1 Tax=Racocetra fulgida TaxID=60492 RepID=A0A9N8WGM9_9GLOM|nr:18903_t:CDS:2 [Racocetra fulgida]
MSSDFGIPTPPATGFESFDGKDQFFFDNPSVSEKDVEKDSSNVDPIDQFILTAPPSVHDNTDGSDEPSTPTSPDPVAQSGSRYLIHNSFLPTFIPQVAAAHQIKIPDSYSLSSCAASSVDSIASTTSSTTSSKRKRKGIPLRSPNRDDVESDPGMVFCFPVLFPPTITNTNTKNSDKNSIPKNISNTESSSSQQKITTNTDNMNNGDIIKSFSQARRSKMRTRPVTRAKNKRESQELELLKLTGLDHIIDTPDNNGSNKNDEEPVTNSSRRTAAMNGQKFLTTYPNSQISRTNTNSANGGDKQNNRSNNHNGNLQYYRNSNQRRTSVSVSSLSSIPTSELSDYDLNSDNFGDDEDDPDFAPPTKKRKGDHSPSKYYPNSSSTLHMTHRRESGNKTKVCAMTNTL